MKDFDMAAELQSIDPNDLVPMDLCVSDFPLEINLAYALDAPPNIFGEIYSSDAKLWLHKDLAKIVCRAAQICYEQTGYSLVLYDGLRTSDAQEAMAQTEIVKANPQWMQKPRLLSPPGAGAHPRAMAIDISVIDTNGHLLDMGTDFDHLATDQSKAKNPAHREYENLKPEHKANREILDNAIEQAANELGLKLNLYDQEWWDFRFKKKDYERYAPLSDSDLPQEMRMVSTIALDDEGFENKYRPRIDEIKNSLDALSNIEAAVSAPKAG